MKLTNPVKKVAAIHDLSGFGRASLTVVIPILSRMGIQVCPLPTAVLSTHSKFKDFHFVDLTEELQPMIDHWKGLDLKFDAIYSGFLGSHKQIEIVKQFIHDFRNEDQKVIVDPVFGDNGKIYGPLSKVHVEEMKSLIEHADIITPNLTEAAFLLDEQFPEHIEQEEIKEWIRRLSAKGPKVVIVTSVHMNSHKGQTAVVAYNRHDDRFWRVACNYLPAEYPGTGDAFASVITGALLQGDSLPIAIDRAVQFTSMGVRATFGYEYNSVEGIMLERVLNQLDAPPQSMSYELI
jgi:pyridoxine kinase